MVAVAARRDAAHIDRRRSRLESLEAPRWQLLGIILEVRDVQLVEPPGADRLHADRDVLEVFLTLLRGDDDDVALFGDRRFGSRLRRWGLRRVDDLLLRGLGRFGGGLRESRGGERGRGD